MNEEKAGRHEHTKFVCFGSSQGSEMAGNCPMAEMCQGLIKKPKVGLMIMIPAFMFIFLGILILLKPKVLIWFIGGVFILLGFAMLAGALFLRNLSADRQSGLDKS